MLDHIGIGVGNPEASKAFFLEALAPLGVRLAREVPDAVGLGKDVRINSLSENYASTKVAVPVARRWRRADRGL